MTWLNFIHNKKKKNKTCKKKTFAPKIKFIPKKSSVAFSRGWRSVQAYILWRTFFFANERAAFWTSVVVPLSGRRRVHHYTLLIDVIRFSNTPLGVSNLLSIDPNPLVLIAVVPVQANPHSRGSFNSTGDCQLFRIWVDYQKVRTHGLTGELCCIPSQGVCRWKFITGVMDMKPTIWTNRLWQRK